MQLKLGDEFKIVVFDSDIGYKFTVVKIKTNEIELLRHEDNQIYCTNISYLTEKLNDGVITYKSNNMNKFNRKLNKICIENLI